MLTKATDITTQLEDRPGTLAKLTDTISKAGVNIDGFCGSADMGNTFHFLFISDPVGGRKALERAGAKVKKEREVILVDVQDRPGAAAAEFHKVAQQELNVDLVYLATDNRIVIGGDELPKIREALSMETTKVKV